MKNNLILCFFSITLLISCAPGDVTDSTTLVDSPETIAKMVDYLNDLSSEDQFVIFSTNKLTFVQVKYIPELAKYELSIPLNDRVSLSESKIISLYNEENIEWKKNDVIGEDMEFIDIYVSTPDEVARISQKILIEIYYGDGMQLTIELH